MISAAPLAASATTLAIMAATPAQPAGALAARSDAAGAPDAPSAPGSFARALADLAALTAHARASEASGNDTDGMPASSLGPNAEVQMKLAVDTSFKAAPRDAKALAAGRDTPARLALAAMLSATAQAGADSTALLAATASWAETVSKPDPATAHAETIAPSGADASQPGQQLVLDMLAMLASPGMPAVAMLPSAPEPTATPTTATPSSPALAAATLAAMLPALPASTVPAPRDTALPGSEGSATTEAVPRGAAQSAPETPTIARPTFEVTQLRSPASAALPERAALGGPRSARAAGNADAALVPERAADPRVSAVGPLADPAAPSSDNSSGFTTAQASASNEAQAGAQPLPADARAAASAGAAAPAQIAQRSTAAISTGATVATTAGHEDQAAKPVARGASRSAGNAIAAERASGAPIGEGLSPRSERESTAPITQAPQGSAANESTQLHASSDTVRDASAPPPSTQGAAFKLALASAAAGNGDIHNAHLGATVGTPEFAPALGVQVSLLVRDGISEARLQVHPAELGPIAVQIALDGRSAQVHMSAEHAATRQALEQALPMLASALRDAGMTLTGGGVSQQPPQSQAQGDARPDANRADRRADGRTAAQGADDGAAPLSGVTTRARVQRGAVDLYA